MFHWHVDRRSTSGYPCKGSAWRSPAAGVSLICRSQIDIKTAPLYTLQLPIKIRPYKCCLYISIYLTINITILCLINTKKTQTPAIRWVFCIVSLACFLTLRKIIFFIPIPHLAIPDFFQLLHKSHGNRAGSKNDRRNFKKAKSTLKFQCFKRAFILKLVENTGVEPVTSWLPVMRAPSCANSPYFLCLLADLSPCKRLYIIKAVFSIFRSSFPLPQHFQTPWKCSKDEIQRAVLICREKLFRSEKIRPVCKSY